jgi:trigger factor
MNIQYQKTDNVNALLTVTLAEADYAPKLKEKVKEYSKKVQLKGFRPGQVPASLVEKMYGTSLKVDQVNQLLSESVIGYIRDKKLQIIGEPLPKSNEAIDWAKQTDFHFEYELGLVGDFDPQISTKRKFEAFKIKVTDEVMKETLERLRKQFGKNQEAEIVSEGDFISGQLKAHDGSFDTNTTLPLSKLNDSELQKFTGKAIGDVVTFDIRKAFNNDSDYIAHASGATKEAASQMNGDYTFTIEKIQHPGLADFDQEFYDKVFGKDTVKSFDEFNQKLKEDIERNYDNETREYLKNQVYKNLVETVDIELPKDFLKRWMLLRNADKVTEDSLDKEFGPFLDGLKWNLIQGKLAEEGGIKVEGDEVQGRVKNMYLGYFGQTQPSPEIEDVVNKMVDKYLTEENGKNYNRMLEQIEFEKTLEYILGKVTVSEKAVSVDEFREIVSKENKKN